MNHIAYLVDSARLATLVSLIDTHLVFRDNHRLSLAYQLYHVLYRAIKYTQIIYWKQTMRLQHDVTTDKVVVSVSTIVSAIEISICVIMIVRAFILHNALSQRCTLMHRYRAIASSVCVCMISYRSRHMVMASGLIVLAYVTLFVKIS